jgi:hypothetical protein
MVKMSLVGSLRDHSLRVASGTVDEQAVFPREGIRTLRAAVPSTCHLLDGNPLN